MATFFARLRDWWEAADRTQRTVTVIGGGLLIGLLALTATMASRPRMEPLYSGLTATEQSAAVQALDQAGIEVHFDASGNLLVPKGDVAAARMALAQANALPAASAGGEDLLSGVNAMTTPSIEQERIRANAEMKLSRSIQTMDGVAAATVHISPADDSPFVRDRSPAEAAVILTPKAGGALGQRQGEVIARLVQNSVPQLTVENISVATTDGVLLWDGQKQSVNSGSLTRLELEGAEAERRERELQRALDTAFGPGSTIVALNLELDLDESRLTRDTTQLSDTPLSKEEVTEEMSDGATSTGGDPIAANIGAEAPTAIDGDNRSYKSESTAVQNIPSEITREERVRVPGEVKSMAISVLVDSGKIDDVTPVQSFVDSYLGDRVGAAGFTSTVTSAEFDTSMEQRMDEAAKAATGAERMQQLISLLPIAALVIVGFLVMRSIGKAAKEAQIPTSVRAISGGASGGGTPLTEGGSGPNRQYVNADVIRAAEQGNVEALQIISEQNPELVKAIEQKVNIPLEQIKHMAKTKPEAIATLLKGWMMEEHA